MKRLAIPVGALALVICALWIRDVAAQSPFSITQTYCTGTTPCVTTYHNDNNRDGTNPNETTLSASTLGTSGHTPSPQYMVTTDGQIYAQPLYIKSMSINGSTHNAVYVATENNTVYAMDGGSGSTLLSMNLNNASDLSGYTEIAVPYSDLPNSCGNIAPEVGITGTPVIDVSITPPVIWLVTKHEDVNGSTKTYRQKLHGLFATTLQEIPGSPLVLDSAWATANSVSYDPLANHQRSGLALTGQTSGTANIVVAWASHCDKPNYNGLAVGFAYSYSGGTLSTTWAFNPESGSSATSPQGGIWMGGGAPAIDPDSHAFFSTGNGDASNQGTGEYSDSVIRLKNNGTGTLDDYYTPPDYVALNGVLGGASVACTQPNTTCPSPCASTGSPNYYCNLSINGDDWDLASAGGNQGMLYVVYGHSMGHIDSESSNPSEYPCTQASSTASGTIAQCFFGITTPTAVTGKGIHSTPAFLAGGTLTGQQNYLYVVGSGDVLNAWNFQNSSGYGTFNATQATESGHTFNYPGSTPSVTWSGSGTVGNTAIVWVLDNSNFGKITPMTAAQASVLYAYAAIPSSGTLTALWNSSSYNTTTPGSPGAVKFIPPTIVDGKIFMGGGAQGYEPGSTNCPAPTTSNGEPTACGGLTMFQ